MILFITASSDNYITNKIVDGSIKNNSNVGYAGTLDLFSLYDESTITGSHELSRILVKFNFEEIQFLTSSILNISNLKSYLRMKNITAGNPCPSNFTISAFPLLKKFNEGFGRDIVSFSDLGFSNWVTSSENENWSIEGCDDPISDYIFSMEKKQDFPTGIEDLNLDVTEIVSSSIAGLIENFGFRISYTGSQENDGTSRFVKRFASRHSKNTLNRPILELRFDDSRIDERNTAFFDRECAIYLDSSFGDQKSNFVNLDGSEMTGSSCGVLTLSTASYSASFNVSQRTVGGHITGEYVSYIFLSSSDSAIVSGSSTLSDYIDQLGEITFKEEWKTADLNKTLYSGEITLSKQLASPSIFERNRLMVRCDGPREINKKMTLIRVLFYDIFKEDLASKFYFERKPIYVKKSCYRVIDAQTGAIIIDFDDNFTKLSLDQYGNYFTLDSSILIRNRPITLEFKIMYHGSEFILSDKNYSIKLGS